MSDDPMRDDPMTDEEEFQDLMRRVAEGSEDAVRELLDRYGHFVFQAVRRRLNSRMRTRYDSEDFVQSVWASFFRGPDQLALLANPERLAKYLCVMAHRKVIDESRRCFKYGNQNLDRERRLRTTEPPNSNLLNQAVPEASKDEGAYPISNDPSPSQIAVAREQWSRMIAGQPELWQRVAEMATSGASQVEIADTLNINARSVRRILKKLAERLQR